jgi:hypothetical protein
MLDAAFKPVLYLKQGCPFCFKLRLFLLESGQLDAVSIREFASDTDEEKAIRAELEPHLEKVGFPAAQLAPGRYVVDSDVLVDHFARAGGADPAGLPTYQAYLAGPFQTIGRLFRENRELKSQAS